MNNIEIDPEDIPKIAPYTWHIKIAGIREYAFARINGNDTPMHHLILNIVRNSNKIIDHKDGNGLNNKKENLRIVSNRFNTNNNSMRREGKTKSKYFGVTSSVALKKPWRARYWSKESGHYCIGSYATEIEAAKAYNEYIINNIQNYDPMILNDLNISM